MDYQVVEVETKKYIECVPDGRPIASERDVLDLLAACGENDTNLLMIQGEALSDDFFTLGTGLAGMVLQKLVNYHIKAALVVTDDRSGRGRFREFAIEANRGRDFRIFDNKEAAEEWLVGR